MESPAFRVRGAGGRKWLLKWQGLLAGYRNTSGSFNNRGTNANFWSSSVNGSNAWNRNLNSGNATVNRNNNNQANGFSVRCLKDWLDFNERETRSKAVKNG